MSLKRAKEIKKQIEFNNKIIFALRNIKDQLQILRINLGLYGGSKNEKKSLKDYYKLKIRILKYQLKQYEIALQKKEKV